MKKIFPVFVLIFVFSTKIFAADYYSAGVDAFNKGGYESAASNLEHAIRITPKNVNARYYLAQVYLKQNRIDEAKEQYSRIIVLAPDSFAATLSEKGLSLIQQSQKLALVGGSKSLYAQDDLFAKYKDNYFDYVLPNDGQIIKWASFPVKVYIEPQKQKSVVESAFKQWQEQSNNLVSFAFVNSPQAAQVRVNLKDNLEDTSKQESFISGYSKPYYQNGHISSSDINLLVVNPNTKADLSDNLIYFSALHEIGHTLGFVGHSPNPNDIMYSISNDKKSGLTKRDLNTLNLFYRLTPKSMLARNTGQTDIQFQQALDYVKKTPNKSVGWANLGDVYRSKKMYSDAIMNYKKAIAIEPSKAEFYDLIGISYAAVGDNQNAFYNLKHACEVDPTSEIYLQDFTDTCLKTGQKNLARKYLANFLKNNPDSASGSTMQSIINKLK